MDYILLSWIFIFGLIIGSFLNVVILRFNTGLGLTSQRSRCFSCGKVLRWYELLPLASFLIQKGRCRGCHSKISWQYPLVELATGIALTSLFYLIPDYSILYAVVLCLYIVIFAYDLRHKIIPDLFSYLASITALLIIALAWYRTGFLDIYKIAAGPLLFLFFYFFWKVSKGRWMGLGDAKLALSVGWILGLNRGISAILLSFWIGALVSLLIIGTERMLHKKSIGLGSEIPFGPFIIIGFALVFFFNIDIQTILLYLAV